MKRTMLVTVIILASMLTAFSLSAYAQGNQLTLADILIALRSKKVTLSDRNRIITEAVNVRGTTFSLTPEIEKELTVTGADRPLLDSIRQRSQMVKISAANPSTVDPRSKTDAPKTEPLALPVPDFAFYKNRADASVAKGDLDAALVDYTKAIGMNGSAVSALIGRGNSYLAKKAYTLAIADYSKVIELEPKNAAVFVHRAEANDRNGNSALAADDYKKAFELDPSNEAAKGFVERLNAEQAKRAQKTEPAPAPIETPVILPEFVDLGSITESRMVKVVKPIYSPIAIRSDISGQVVVAIELDTQGNVTKAKAVSGSPYLTANCEDAARRSKFKPAMIGDKPVNAKAQIVYNFVKTN